MRILLVSTYELGHQPLGIAAPAAALRSRGFEVGTLDIANEMPSASAIRDADVVAISVPMHTATRLGIELARRIRKLNPDAHVVFYGLYATPMYDRLMREGLADSVIGGEYEPALVELAESLAAGRREPVAGVGATPLFPRNAVPLPDREGLAPLESYAQLRIGGELLTAAYVEATRGCAHTCTHCPITPVYGGRLRLVSSEIVLADIEQQVAMGARHVTFGDPDFFNAIPHSLAILESMHERWPALTFDATIKVEHLVESASLLPRLRELGCVFITSAFESTDDAVLATLAKGHTRAEMLTALASAAEAGIPLRPTWVAFTPWTTADAFLDMLAFIETNGLVNNVQPVQYPLKLLLPPGSPLVDVLAPEGRLGAFDDEALTYGWSYADDRLDGLQRELSALVESAAGGGTNNEAMFRAVKAAALRHLTGYEGEITVAPQPAGDVPGLTEAWFCCAEPTTAQLAPLDVALRFGEDLLVL